MRKAEFTVARLREIADRLGVPASVKLKKDLIPAIIKYQNKPKTPSPPRPVSPAKPQKKPLPPVPGKKPLPPVPGKKPLPPVPQVKPAKVQEIVAAAQEAAGAAAAAQQAAASAKSPAKVNPPKYSASQLNKMSIEELQKVADALGVPSTVKKTKKALALTIMDYQYGRKRASSPRPAVAAAGVAAQVAAEAATHAVEVVTSITRPSPAVVAAAAAAATAADHSESAGQQATSAASSQRTPSPKPAVAAAAAAAAAASATAGVAAAAVATIAPTRPGRRPSPPPGSTLTDALQQSLAAQPGIAQQARRDVMDAAHRAAVDMFHFSPGVSDRIKKCLGVMK
jgi:hypothetical protein